MFKWRVQKTRGMFVVEVWAIHTNDTIDVRAQYFGRERFNKLNVGEYRRLIVKARGENPLEAFKMAAASMRLSTVVLFSEREGRYFLALRTKTGKTLAKSPGFPEINSALNAEFLMFKSLFDKE